MNDFIIGFVVGYILTQAVIIWYFFVYKPSQADKEYEQKMREIYDKEWK